MRVMDAKTAAVMHFFMLVIKTCRAAKAVSTWMDYDGAG